MSLPLKDTVDAANTLGTAIATSESSDAGSNLTTNEGTSYAEVIDQTLAAAIMPGVQPPTYNVIAMTTSSTIEADKAILQVVYNAGMRTL